MNNSVAVIYCPWDLIIDDISYTDLWHLQVLMSFKESSSAYTLLCYILFYCGYNIPNGLIGSIYPNYFTGIAVIFVLSNPDGFGPNLSNNNKIQQEVNYSQCQKLSKIIQVRRASYSRVYDHFMFADRLFEIKLHLFSTVWRIGFQRFWELWNPLSKAIPGNFHGSGSNSKCKSL